MEFLGIGPSELVFILIIALIVLGPRDMQKAGRTIGKWMRRIVTSDGWKLFQQTSREIQTLPNRLMREAALDELREVQKDLRQPLDISHRPSEPPAPGTPQAAVPVEPKPDPSAQPENKILPPSGTPTPPTTPTDDKDKNA
jgi:sec-independent protein translocase protein TatB